jgi:hypothetical protein
MVVMQPMASVHNRKTAEKKWEKCDFEQMNVFEPGNSR